jgi:hypothetical protein
MSFFKFSMQPPINSLRHRLHMGESYMGDPALDEQRRSARRVLTKLLPGPLLDQEQKVLHCRPIDLSQEGLSILTEVQLSIGQQLTLKTHNQSVTLEVVWQRQDFGKHGLMRYGLRAIDPTTDLEHMFRSTGCLK